MSLQVPNVNGHFHYRNHVLVIMACVILFAVIMEIRVRTAEHDARIASVKVPAAEHAFDTAIKQAHVERQHFWNAALKRQAEQEKKLQRVISTQNQIIDKLSRKP